MPHMLQGKNKLDRNIHLNSSISEVKSPDGSLCRQEMKACFRTKLKGPFSNNINSSVDGWAMKE